MKDLTKQEALNKIEELKKYISDEETKKKGYIIGSRYDDSEIYVSTKDNVRDAVIEAVEEGADLSDADLSGADLSGADLSGANLIGVNLSGANLSGADLSKADLSEANLIRAELQNAKFYGKGGDSILKQSQVKDFLLALGVIIEKDE